MSGLKANHQLKAHEKLQLFLHRWPPDRVRKMRLRDYSKVGDKDTFCYWLEFETEELGRIGGRPSNKFGIWSRNRKDGIKARTYRYDREYAWYAKYGDTAEAAFRKVKHQIIRIMEHALAGEFEAIDYVELDSLTRWKIAFMYSDYALMPIYKKEVVRNIAQRLGFEDAKRTPLSVLHRYIVSHRPSSMDFFDYAWVQFHGHDAPPLRNYFVLGTRYGGEENDWEDMLPVMIRKAVVSTGFLWDYDFTSLVGKSRHIVKTGLERKVSNSYPRYREGKRTLEMFLNLKPGDIIALRSDGKFNRLTIVAYALVKGDDRVIYQSGDEELGHTIAVEFLETGLSIFTGLTYGQTIHQLIPGERDGHFEKIFGSYAALENITSITNQDKDAEWSAGEDRINEKQMEDGYRDVAYSTILSRAHNRLQIAFARYLKRLFPLDTIRTEDRRVDVTRENTEEVYYYEVKPFNSVYACVRAGIGQLLDYSFDNPRSGKQLNLRIVGAAEPGPDDLRFIAFVKGHLNLSFEYIPFNPADKY